MLTLGPAFVFIITCVMLVLLFKYLDGGKRNIRVIKEEQLYNRYEEEHNKELPATRTNTLPQRNPVTREERSRKRGNTILREEGRTEEDRDPGIV